MHNSVVNPDLASKPRVRKRFLYRLICWTVASAGLIWQVYYISTQYFAYDTVTVVTIARPAKLTPPVLQICVKRSTLISSNESTMTIHEIFQQTPTTDEIVQKVTVHSTNHYAMENSPAGKERFKFGKHLKKYFVCYSTEMMRNVSFKSHLLFNGLIGAKFYRLHINASYFEQSEYLYINTHPLNTRFYGKCDSYTEHAREIHDLTGKGNKNYVTLSYSYFQSIRLPYPYSTNCIDYSRLGYESSSHCFEDCLFKRSAKVLKKIPFSVLVDKATDMQLISEEDNFNATLFNILKQLETECGKSCSQKTCITEEYIPRVLTASHEEHMIFELYASSEPYIISQYKPLLSIIDFVTYLLSCFSFWLGISPLGLLLDKVSKPNLGRSL